MLEGWSYSYSHLLNLVSLMLLDCHLLHYAESSLRAGTGVTEHCREGDSLKAPSKAPVLNMVVGGDSPGAETGQDGKTEQEASFL